MPVAPNRVAIFVLCGAIPVAYVACLSTSLAPDIFGPGPLFTLLPTFVLFSVLPNAGTINLYFVVAIVAGTTYLLFSKPLLSGSTRAFRISFGLYVFSVVGNIVFLFLVFGEALKYQGYTYTVIVSAINIVVAGLVAGLFYFAKDPDRTEKLLPLAHVSLFLWLNWTAFPWLGEMI